jgi:hypothetical protein
MTIVNLNGFECSIVDVVTLKIISIVTLDLSNNVLPLFA